MFNSVEIENFRGFGTLALTGLGRVNLVVGENNTGKKALLEAIALLADPGMVEHLPRLLRSYSNAVNVRFYSWLLRDGAGARGTLLSAQATDGRETRLALVQPRAENRPRVAREGGRAGDGPSEVVRSAVDPAHGSARGAPAALTRSHSA
jgi:hypothetical protein